MKSFKSSYWNHFWNKFSHLYVTFKLQRGTYCCGKTRPFKTILRNDILTGIQLPQGLRREETAFCLEPLHLSFSWSTMPHLFSDIPDKMRVILSQAANVFLVFIMIYIFQYIFNSQFSCSCTPEFHYIVVIYLGLIPLILFFILKIMKQTKTKDCAACCHGFCPQIFQLFGIALFWGGFVILDGDFFLCLVTKNNDTLLEIPCKKDSDLTLQEKSTITIYKNKSQVSSLLCWRDLKTVFY